MNELNILRKLLKAMISKPLNENSNLSSRELWDIYAFVHNLDLEIRELLDLPNNTPEKQRNLLAVTESLLAAWNELDKHPKQIIKPQPVIKTVIHDLMVMVGGEGMFEQYLIEESLLQQQS